MKKKLYSLRKYNYTKPYSIFMQNLEWFLKKRHKKTIRRWFFKFISKKNYDCGSRTFPLMFNTFGTSESFVVTVTVFANEPPFAAL